MAPFCQFESLRKENFTMTANNGQTIQIASEAVEALRARHRGPLLLPGAADYDTARTIWNAMIDRRPALVARCQDAADVVAGVDFARERGLPLSIKGGGHNIAGTAVGEGLMLDLSPLRDVRVNPEARTAAAQPGCLLSDVDRATQEHGLAAVLGFISTTGIAGLTLGGGFGYLTRRFGWTCDNVLSMEVVTADGCVVTASETENPDLFWGLRGGGGNFGVVTNFTYKLYPVGPKIIAGAVAWPGADAPAVLAMYRELVASAPPEQTVVAALRKAPPAPWLPADVHGQPIVALFVCDTGPLAEAEARAAAIKSFGAPVGDVLQRRTYVSQQALIDGTQPPGRRYYWKSEYLPRLEPELLSRYIDNAWRMVSPFAAILLFPIGGALNQLPGDYSAVGNRDAAFTLAIAAGWERAEDDAANIAWVRQSWQDLRRFSTGGTYVNFLTEEEGDERIRAAYGRNYERLIDVKTRWDPHNLFQANKNVAPRV
jgi:FAD/FMN-containing dehydrogenase